MSMETLVDSCWESFKKAYLEEWIFTGDDSSDEQGVSNFPVLLLSIGNSDYRRDDDPPTPTPSRQPDSLPWAYQVQDKASFWERIEAPYSPSWPRCNFIHPRQLVSFLNAWSCPFSSDEILSGYEDFVSSGTNQFTA